MATVMGASPALALAAEGTPIAQTEQGAPPAASSDALILDQLETLAETQTWGEVQSILNSGERVQALYDVDTDQVVSAFIEEPYFTTQAITQRGPGCATTDACIVNKSIGFYGTGALAFSGTITGVTKLFSGDKGTTWWRNATTGIVQNVNVTLNLTSAVSLVSITRS